MKTHMEKHDASEQWDVAERSGLSRLLDSGEKLIRVHLNGSDDNDGDFDLYYFVHTAAGTPTSKSVLFCAGGPGQIIRTLDRANTYADFLSKFGYNVVFFHLRGTGFSQIPAENHNDKFLRATFAVQDMEAIRLDFLDKRLGRDNMPWEAIVGWSFGTVLAQLYAERFHKRNLVKRLVLISPLSRHMFNDSRTAYNDYYKEMLGIYRKTLNHIFESPKERLRNEFGDLATQDKDHILDKLFNFDNGTLIKTEQAFGSIQSVIDAYSDIDANTFDQFKLQKYSRPFYQSLRDLRIFGANAIDDSGIIEQQRLIGKTLRDELLPKRVPLLEEPAGDNYDQGSQRAYYSFGIQDGLNWVFLREYYERAHSVADSVKAIGGVAATNTSLNKVKVTDLLEMTPWNPKQSITPWDPADHDHDVPTLILNGELDSVTASGQAERYLKTELRGERTLIVFPSIGHAISLGAIFEEYNEDQHPMLSGAIRVDLPRISPDQVLERTCIATGLEFNRNLRLDLETPEDLQKTITIHGCGILRASEDHLGKTEHRHPNSLADVNVVALVESKKPIPIQGHNWLLRTPLLRGTVRFVVPGEIPADKICAIFGRLTHAHRNPDHAYQIRPMLPKDDVHDRLELFGYNLKAGGSIELWFRNPSEKTLGGPIVVPWTIQKTSSRFGFRVTIPTLKEHEIISLIVAVDGLKFDATETLAINPPKGQEEVLKACFDPKAANSDRLSIIVWNQGQGSRQIDEGWTISCAVFSAKVELERTEVEPNTVKTVSAHLTGIEWVNYLEIEPPFKWNDNLRLLSVNIQERNSVSMLFKNRGGSIRSASNDWKYVDPTVDGNDPAIDRALNCLIFSFLVLNPSQFCIPEDNNTLRRIQNKFKELSLELKISSALKDKRQGHDP